MAKKIISKQSTKSAGNGNQTVRKRGLLTLLESMKPVEESFPEVDDAAPPPEQAF